MCVLNGAERGNESGDAYLAGDWGGGDRVFYFILLGLDAKKGLGLGICIKGNG